MYINTYERYTPMTKKEIYTNTLKTILKDRRKLEEYLVAHSNLPGPRSNLELAFALAEIYDDLPVLLQWLNITEEQADVNDPRSFLAFCGAVSLGKVYTKIHDPKIIKLLKQLANDGRWRMREAVAFSFQYIGEDDFNTLKTIFTAWLPESNNNEKRAILVSLAHPKFLNRENAACCFEIADSILKDMDRDKDFEVLKKGLQFTLSVFAAADPETGFTFLEKRIGHDKIINRIIRENLKKKRLSRLDPARTEKLLSSI